MALVYTTDEAIMRRLKGRLELPKATTLGRTPIDPALLQQVAEQAEARLNLALKDRYKLPLKSKAHPVLAEFVELRSICMLVPIYFQRQTPSDDRGIGDNSCKEAEKLLNALVAGDLRLDGEVPAKSEVLQGDAPTRVFRRKPGVAERIKF